MAGAFPVFATLPGAATHRLAALVTGSGRKRRDSGARSEPQASGVNYRNCGITFSPSNRTVSRHAACGTVPIWIRNITSSAPASWRART